MGMLPPPPPPPPPRGSASLVSSPPEPELLLSVSGSRCLRGRLLDPDIAKSSSGNLFGLKVAEAPGKPFSEDRG